MLRVLIVEDSETMRILMRRALEADPEIRVCATAENGIEGIEAVQKYGPDIVTMDILMPGMNGLDATRRIMEECPLPIVMVSSIGDSHEQRTSFKAMEAGAVWVVSKPKVNSSAELEKWSAGLRRTVKSMAEVQVVTRRSRAKKRVEVESPLAADIVAPSVIAIGASTGGPNAIRDLLTGLPRDYPIPILICQHITMGFVSGLVDWLKSAVDIPVRMAGNLDSMEAGVTISPDYGHLEVVGQQATAVVADDGAGGIVPSADRLFSSVAEHYGSNAVGILLTGMGRDGARGMGDLHRAGAITIAQNRESSLVYGMPGAAVADGYVSLELSLDGIGAFLRKLERERPESGKSPRRPVSEYGKRGQP